MLRQHANLARICAMVELQGQLKMCWRRRTQGDIICLVSLLRLPIEASPQPFNPAWIIRINEAKTERAVEIIQKTGRNDCTRLESPASCAGQNKGSTY